MANIRNLLVFIGLLLLALVGCRKDPTSPTPTGTGSTGHVRLKFIPEWEGAPFQAFTELQNISGYRVQIEKVQFYVSGLHFRSNDRMTEKLGVMFVDLIDGPMDTIFRVGSGSWMDLNFGLGLPPELNSSSPSLYPNGHPLSGSYGMHWPMDGTGSYIFTKFEGRHDLEPGSSGPFPNAFTIHTGFDTAFINVALPSANAISIPANDTVTVNVRVAIDRFFYSQSGGTIDLATEFMSHGSNIPLSLKLARNVGNSFTWELQ